MATDNLKPHTLFLVPTQKHQPRELSEVRRDLERTMERLRECHASSQRAQILREMRVLIEEADRAATHSEDPKHKGLQVMLPRNRS